VSSVSSVVNPNSKPNNNKTMSATIENNTLIIRLPLQSPRPSSTGKSLVVATSGGNQVMPTAIVNGKPVTIGVNAYIKP